MTDTSVDTRIDWVNAHRCGPYCVDFPSVVAFLIALHWGPSWFLDSICPPVPWTAAQCVSWWLQGLWGEESLLEKREGFSRGSANTSVSVVQPNCPSAQQGKEGFPTHYRVPFVQHVVEGMSLESGHCLPCTSLHAVSLYCSRTI